MTHELKRDQKGTGRLRSRLGKNSVTEPRP
jgi:hypothetical protein